MSWRGHGDRDLGLRRSDVHCFPFRYYVHCAEIGSGLHQPCWHVLIFELPVGLLFLEVERWTKIEKMDSRRDRWTD